MINSLTVVLLDGIYGEDDSRGAEYGIRLSGNGIKQTG